MPTPLYPLRFEPIFKANLWGGNRLRPLFKRVAATEPIGEAWLLSDVDGNESRVSNGPLAGMTLRELMATYSSELLGKVKPIDGRFPLLLKLIDARQELSVQVHPTDEKARTKDPRAAGKTEAWVILDADPATSRIYAGFNAGVTPESFREAVANGTAGDSLHQYTPERGDCVFLPAGTVHAIGADILLFEVQQTSDITYRLYDWNRVDANGKPRDLHIDDGLACSDFAKGPCGPVNAPRDDHGCRTLVDCDYFELEEHVGGGVTTRGFCRIYVAIEGQGTFAGEPFHMGDAVLVPASVSVASPVSTDGLKYLICTPKGSA